MEKVTLAEAATYLSIIVSLTVIGVLYSRPRVQISEVAPTVNSETFRCSETLSRKVSITFRSVRYADYAEYFALVGIDDTDFYGFVKYIEKQPKLKISNTGEYLLPPGGEWTLITELPDGPRKNWPGIENLFSNDEKMALWTCFLKKRGFKYT